MRCGGIFGKSTAGMSKALVRYELPISLADRLAAIVADE